MYSIRQYISYKYQKHYIRYSYFQEQNKVNIFAGLDLPTLNNMLIRNMCNKKYSYNFRKYSAIQPQCNSLNNTTRKHFNYSIILNQKQIYSQLPDNDKVSIRTFHQLSLNMYWYHFYIKCISFYLCCRLHIPVECSLDIYLFDSILLEQEEDKLNL